MTEVKDKVVTAESLYILHEHNKEMVDNVESSLTEMIDEVATRVTPIEYGGTGASDGSIGLENLFASGATILSSHQYGDELPEAGTAGRIFFKRFTDI